MGDLSTLKLVRWVIVVRAESDKREKTEHLGAIKVSYLVEGSILPFIKLFRVTE